MTFRRSISGISNFHLFIEADVVVFVEGGKSFNRSEVDNGAFTGASPDIRFWRSLFTLYRPNVKYQFRSIGSKETVKSIARDIGSGSVKNAVVAMDRDFDNINDKLISSSNILYTCGYSWENDAWNEETLYETFCSLTGSCTTGSKEDAEFIRTAIRSFFTYMRGAIKVDAILSQYGNSLFDREKPGRYVKINKGGCPAINTDQVIRSLADARVRNKRPILRKKQFMINNHLDCFGHLLAEYAYRIIAFLIEQAHSLPRIPKEYASCMIVEKFGQAFVNGIFPTLKQHYDYQFAKVRP